MTMVPSSVDRSETTQTMKLPVVIQTITGDVAVEVEAALATVVVVTAIAEVVIVATEEVTVAIEEVTALFGRHGGPSTGRGRAAALVWTFGASSR